MYQLVECRKHLHWRSASDLGRKNVGSQMVDPR
ncbi:Uncharacterised protein [Vibrio cholerae]|nr:Uncharacterised protein [Vibrio cholerae]